MTVYRTLLSLAARASLVLSQSTKAQTTFTVTNFSFESPDLGDSAYYPNRIFPVPNWQPELFGGRTPVFRTRGNTSTRTRSVIALRCRGPGMAANSPICKSPRQIRPPA